MWQIKLRTIINMLLLIKRKNLRKPPHVLNLMKIPLIYILNYLPLLIQTRLPTIIRLHNIIILKYLLLQLLCLIRQINHPEAIEQNWLFNVQFLTRIIVKVRRSVYAYQPRFFFLIYNDFKREYFETLIKQLVLRL